MNLTDMRAIVRRNLHDEDSGNYRWTNDEVDRHIAHAVKDLSEAIPCQQKATKATSSGSREIDISSITDRVIVNAVEYPVDKFPSNYQRFALWGDTLTLLGPDVPDGANAYIYYGKLHTLDGSPSTIAAVHEELVATGAGGYAATEWAVYAVNSTNLGGRGTPEEFMRWGREQLAHFRRETRRQGRKGRIRMRSLYGAYYSPVSQTTDYGPSGG